MIIAICEDRPEDLVQAEELVDLYLKERNIKGQVYSYQKGEALLDAAQRIAFDILLLDIFLPKQSGIKIAGSIKRLNPGCRIIFTTSSPDYAVAAYEIGAIHYLIKPLSKQALEEAMNRCIEKGQTGESGQFLEITVDRQRLPFNLDGIRYIESRGKMLVLHTSQGEYNTWTSLKKVQEQLKDGSFIKLQRSYLVNMNYIVQIKNGCCSLKDGTMIPINRSCFSEIREQYKKYIFSSVRKDDSCL